MVCEEEVREEIAEGLGVDVTGALQSTWADPLFTCTFTYAEGAMVISVRQQADEQSTVDYFARQRKAQAEVVPGLGKEAFALPDGSLFIRKDFMVLQVDVSGLPETFGKPPHPRNQVAITAASVIMHCWIENG